MPKGEHLTRAHQSLAGMRPRPGRGPSRKEVEAQRLPTETMDEATLRLQIARADTEELDRKKRQLELDRARGELVTKDEAVDLAQAAVLRVCQVLDLLPERLRDLGRQITLDDVDDAIRNARAEIAKAGA